MDAETIHFTDAAAFEAWLDEHTGHQPGVWLKIAKAGSGIASLTSDEAVDIGLCYGWISGQRRSLDADFFLQKYVPRRPRSLWSRVNVDKVAALTAAGKMRPAGQAEVDRAKADGRWDAAYDSQRNATVPDDLADALAADPAAATAFAALSRSDRYSVLFAMSTARTARSRASQLAKAIERLRSS